MKKGRGKTRRGWGFTTKDYLELENKDAWATRCKDNLAPRTWGGGPPVTNRRESVIKENRVGQVARPPQLGRGTTCLSRFSWAREKWGPQKFSRVRSEVGTN